MAAIEKADIAGQGGRLNAYLLAYFIDQHQAIAKSSAKLNWRAGQP